MAETNVKSSSSSTTSAEKGRISEVERTDLNEKQQSGLYNAHIDVSGVDEKKLLRKLDWWLVPWLSFLYLLSFLDRTSIGNAKVCPYCGQSVNIALTKAQLYGLEKDLGINDTQYNIALTIFFFSYSIFEVSTYQSRRRCKLIGSLQVPSNIFLKRLRPSIWLSLLMLLWGVMMVRLETL